MTFCAESRLAQKVAEKQDFLCKAPRTHKIDLNPSPNQQRRLAQHAE